MDILVRETIIGKSGLQEVQDIEIDCKKLTIGSSASQDIQLLGKGVLGTAAVLTATGDGSFKIKSYGNFSFTVNEEIVRSSSVQIGDVIQLANNQLRLIQAPTGFDLGIEVIRPDLVDASQLENAFKSSIADTGLSSRKLSWLFSVAIVLLTFALPVIGLKLWPGDNDKPLNMISDTIWSSGPLHSVHRLAVNDNCQSCHTEFFVKVQDDACNDCHKEIEGHISDSIIGKNPDRYIRCATCHREHNEPVPELIVRSDKLCVDCHDSNEGIGNSQNLSLVNSFAPDEHAAFKAHLLKPVVSDKIVENRWSYVVEDIDSAKEKSNLKFPHQIHLDSEKVLDPSASSPLVCVDCHQLDRDGEHFDSISMEKHCSACHELTFDPVFPERQLPHGQPEEVIFTLEGHYLKMIGDPDYKPVTSQQRRRPDRKNSKPKTCTDKTYDCALEKASIDTDNQFTRQGCVSCHEVKVSSEKSLYQKYSVSPVRLTEDYFPNSSFDHRSHEVMIFPGDKKSLSGNDACDSCHQSSQSEESSDLLLPDIDVCFNCHESGEVAQKVTVQCVTCHQYHPHEYNKPDNEVSSL